jgi:hypothetical protein
VASAIVSDIVNAARKRMADQSPTSLSVVIPTAKITPATIQPRRIMLPARSPTVVLGSPAFSARRWTSARTRRCPM